MVKYLRKQKRSIYGAVALLITAPAVAKTPTNNLWDFIVYIKSATRYLTVDTVSQYPLSLTLNNQNEYVNFYQSDAVFLDDGSQIDDIDVRLRRIPKEQSAFISFSLKGQCITLAQVRQHYSPLKITDTPRGHSVYEVTSYTAMLNEDQDVSFSFAEIHPECLSGVVIDHRE
ncbi:hypothetical protein [Citrobacter sp. BDA59-3]|uniref:hypothetical protein n=1 Tax=Citrobacter sp. BDA59-3 TaxID=2781952 RepID=UPI001881094C|nr:hypothetical protein [Citrobacter sp. BDA59-3]QOV70676.1 hypothetical protein IP582_09950 [Citrobacter sp. BDA59-3]